MSINKYTEEDFELAKRYFLEGVSLMNQELYSEAESSFHMSLTILPNRESTLTNISAALLKQQKYQETEEFALLALEINQHNPEALINLGISKLKQKQPEIAIDSLKKVIEFHPENFEAWSNMAIAYKGIKEYDLALECFDKSIEINPNFAEAWANRGNLLSAMGFFSQALDSHREAIKLEPNFFTAHSNFIFNLTFNESYSYADLLAEVRVLGSKLSNAAKQKFSHQILSKSPERLKIGFVSGDFRNHSVGHFIEDLISDIDQSQFELYAFVSTSEEDELTYRIKRYFTKWLPIYGMPDQVAASLIYKSHIHILIDLSCHTANNKLPVFSYRPAPVQVSWLGLPLTTGVPEIDYVLGDAYATPPEYEHHFTESIWRLPETYVCLTPPRSCVDVGLLPALHNGFVTFGSFNNPSKMNSRALAVWAKILKSVPNSKLVLKAKQFANNTYCESMYKKFSALGINRSQLQLVSYALNRDAHLTEYNKVDIALDTFPYPGVTTSAEALWMGVPVLTLKGENFMSSTAESIAINSGNPDWVSASYEDYVAKAIRFASDISQLGQMRVTLREKVLRSPLFDSSKFAKNFGEALWGMWNQRV